MPGMMNRVALSKSALLLIGATGAALAVIPVAPLSAQEVVQPLPPREAGQLNAALRRLAKRPTDLDALVSAGNASLTLNDSAAAQGFFARAANVAPGDARVLLGLARVALDQRRPVQALQAFAQAEKAGVRSLDMAADRALAYDLVGDNAAAQGIYRSVLAVGDGAEIRRRLAISLAIAGNRPEFEKVLYPLLKGEDRAAFRTRAFGLAILGLTDDAVGIADAMMPTDLALRMAPYLRYMPRLTKAQQAAAADLGAFPAAAEIGHDSADIASYAAAGARIAARADTSLTPSGAPMGTRAQQAGSTAAKSARRLSSRDRETAPAPAPAPSPPIRMAQAELPPVRNAAVSEPAPSPAPAPVPAAPVTAAPAPSPKPAPPPPKPVVVAVREPEPAAISVPEPSADRPTIADAFADLGPAPVTRVAPTAGAVDVAKLAAARKVAEAKAAKEAEAKAKVAKLAEAKAAKAKAEKAEKAAEPARNWVQVGVGRNVSAFAFDWKKLSKQADGTLDGKGPWAVKFAATNRMLAGPYPSDAAVKTAVKRLKDKGIDALPFHSDAGEKVTKAN